MLISQLISLYQMLLFNCVFVAYVNTICDFNTSNVTIQPIMIMVFLTIIFHFNTSNVTIQLLPLLSAVLLYYHFNTSNVTIQRYAVERITAAIQISIHLMLLFNHIQINQQYLIILISIHLMLLFNLAIEIVKAGGIEFQYI